MQRVAMMRMSLLKYGSSARTAVSSEAASVALVVGSIDAPAAAAARSSGSNWRGGGTGWRRSIAHAGKCCNVNSATAVW